MKWFIKGKNPSDLLDKWQKEIKSKIPSKIDLKSLQKINFQTLIKTLGDIFKNPPSSSSNKMGPSRPMKFPYTFTAKIAQFPYKFYFKNNWMFRYYPFGIAGSLPVFWYINRIMNSKENKAKWKEIQRKEKEELHNKFD